MSCRHTCFRNIAPISPLCAGCRGNQLNHAMKEAESKVKSIENRIQSVRGQYVLLDFELAGLYGVTPKTLLQGVRRNRKRFPPDFMFQMTNQEIAIVRSRIAIAKPGAWIWWSPLPSM